MYGWWFVSEVDGTEFEEVFLPLNMTINFNLFFTSSQYVNFGVAPAHDGRRIARGVELAACEFSGQGL